MKEARHGQRRAPEWLLMLREALKSLSSGLVRTGLEGRIKVKYVFFSSLFLLLFFLSSPWARQSGGSACPLGSLERGPGGFCLDFVKLFWLLPLILFELSTLFSTCRVHIDVVTTQRPGSEQHFLQHFLNTVSNGGSTYKLKRSFTAFDAHARLSR